MTQATSRARTLALRTRVLRAWLAFGLVVASAAWLLTGVPKVCRTQVTNIGTAVEVCGAPAVGDAVVVAVACVVALLFLPDLAEIGIGGFLTLKLKEAAAKTQAAEATAEVARVELQLNQLRLAQDVDVEQRQNVNVNVYPSDPQATGALLGGGAERQPIQDARRGLVSGYRSAAAEAAVAGLASLLPPPWVRGEVVGYAPDPATRQLVAIVGREPTDVPPDALWGPDGVLALAWHEGSYAVIRGGRPLQAEGQTTGILGVAAENASGRTVGVAAAFVTTSVWPADDGDGFAAAAQAFGGAWARILVDLLSLADDGG